MLAGAGEKLAGVTFWFEPLWWGYEDSNYVRRIPTLGVARRAVRRSTGVCRLFTDMSDGKSVTTHLTSIGLCPPGRSGSFPRRG